MAGAGKLVLFLANNASVVEGEFKNLPRALNRALGNRMHGLEYDE
jgi:hypothetical protein